MKTFRFLFIALAVMLCINASAHDFEVDGIYYRIIGLKVEVTYRGGSYDSYSDEYSGSVVIPEKVTYNGKEYSVTGIREYTFYNCSGLTSVTIPNSVTYISEYTFYNCSGLTSVTIPNSVTGIGICAFSGCSGLTSVTIPNPVTYIGPSAFEGCSGLTAVHISDLSAWCKIQFGVDLNNFSCNPTYYAHHLYLNGEEITNLVIPDDITFIEHRAFVNCSGITSVTIPNSVDNIGYAAFSGCSGLTNILIEDGDKKISFPTTSVSYPERTFRECPIEKLYIGRNCSTSAFSYISTLLAIVIGNSVTTIGDNVFKDCTGLTNVRFEDGDGDVFLSNTAFSQCPIDTLYLGRNINTSNSSPFSSMSTLPTANITIGNSVTKIGNYLFADCSDLMSIIIPNSVTSIGNFTFRGCSGLTSVTIPNSVTSIGGSAFSGCSGLTSITIPNSVTNIGVGAFSGCSGLTAVYITDLAAWCKIKFNDFDSNPTSCTNNLYLNGEEIKNLVIPDDVTSIGNYAFWNCSGLTSVTIPNSVTSIGERAFDGCSALSNIRIEDCERLLSIKYTAFLSCPLTTLYMGRNISTSNSISPFFDKSTLSTITISNSVTDIGACLFRDCSWLTEIEIPNSVTSISSSAFSGCTSLTNVPIPNSVTSIGSSAFSGCTGLANVSIPNSVTNFENSVFEGCSGLKSLRFEDGEPTLTLPDNFPNTIDSLHLGRNISVKSSYFNTGENKLSVLSIGKYVVSLDDKMFYYCNNITKVISYATEPPVAYPLTFTTDIYGKATLSVPGESMEKYRNADVWKKFYKIEEIDNNPDATEQCAAPVITYADGKLQFTCETAGAECKYTLTAKDIQTAFITASNNSVDLTACYDITAYAVAEGYKNSEKVTATLYWINGSDVSTNINQTEMRGVMATCSGGIITVSGLSDGETVMFYNANGALLYAGAAQNGTVSYAPSASGVIIVKIGTTSIKVVNE